jgi:hypothetical protein
MPYFEMKKSVFLAEIHKFSIGHTRETGILPSLPLDKWKELGSGRLSSTSTLT